MAQGFNKSSRSRKTSGGGAGAGQLPPVTTGRAGSKKVGISPKMSVERKTSKKGVRYC